jgi:hypothetical protein
MPGRPKHRGSARIRYGGPPPPAMLDGIALRASLIALPALLCAVLLAACGGGDSDAREPATADAPAPAGAAADPEAVEVIRQWSDALRRNDVARASSLWATPSRVQNGTPVITLRSAAAVRLFNASLSCGSRLVSALRAPHGFTLAVFKLTERPGGDCGSGTGHTARTAIRVRDGKIAGWYRLPDAGDAVPVQPVAPPEPSAIV